MKVGSIRIANKQSSSLEEGMNRKKGLIREAE
jgi:hypothetical protein